MIDKVAGQNLDDCVEQVLRVIEPTGFEAIHVWQRDNLLPGAKGFEPGISLLANQIAEALRVRLTATADRRGEQINDVCDPGTKVIDIVIEQPSRWWVGCHVVGSEPHQGWPGGVPPLELPLEIISRAYLKLAEAIAWSQIPLRPGQKFVEVGSAPGGACQFLLDQGLRVTGVDPAEMDPRVTSNPHFTFVRGRAISLKRRFFSQFDYLACDATASPKYTIDTAQAIVMHPSNRIRAVILTIKLTDLAATAELPGYLERVSQWGFDRVAARQLAYNRREVTLMLQKT